MHYINLLMDFQFDIFCQMDLVEKLIKCFADEF